MQNSSFIKLITELQERQKSPSFGEISQDLAMLPRVQEANDPTQDTTGFVTVRV